MSSLYVHVPFCIRKCSYCAFYSVALRTPQVQGYLTGVSQEIALRQREIPQEVSTLFIGGGTPSALSGEDLQTLLELIHKSFVFKDSAEKTIEANPGTLTPGKLHIFREQSINRISLGAQSFEDSLLCRIGRIHGAKETQEAVNLIRQAGFRNLNLDLMFGLPGQTLEDWRGTLEAALRIQPEHLSVYGLMLEEGTPLAREANILNDLPDDDAQAEMYHLTREILVKAGYHHYETSNYALPGYECQHNLGYWQGEEYMGIGPGAVSSLKNRRWKNVEDLVLYENALKKGSLPVDPEEDEELTQREKRAERIILGLRLAQGIDLEDFKQEFGEDLFDLYSLALERYLKNGVLIIKKGKFLQMNPEFWFVANYVLQEFV